jgi:hypothetical protein
MQQELDKLKKENELLLHLLNEEQREREAIAAIFHAKKGSISVAIMLLSMIEKSKEKEGITSAAIKEINKLQQDCLDDLYKVYVDICSPMYKLGGLINVLSRYQQKGWLWPKLDISFTTNIEGALLASEYRLTSIYKLCMAGMDYFNAKGYAAINVNFDLINDNTLEVTLVAGEQPVTSNEDDIIAYKYATFKARLVMMRAEDVFFNNSANVAKFIISLADDAKATEAQNFAKALKDKKAKENKRNFEP